ncbi:unnamed protein product [Adineta steineri]|uniref:LysM domain-containing protein n=1 Tax=Adineta steineri TaxID=433720 RepID=A0A819HUY5_9BILA|nr:unnamed protein product [Adineta steineri]CAF3905742.1 unnamed protein product [Adineta steineri]
MSTYTIVPDDTFWGIAQRLGCSVDALISANPGVAPEQLQVGQVIRLPGENTSTGGRMDTTLNSRVPQWLEQLRNAINTASQATNVPADLIAALIYQESNGDVNVVSTSNPNGGMDSSLMQVNQYTAAELEQKYPDRFRNVNGIDKSVMLGASYLRDMYDTVADQNWGITLRAYNSGPNGIDKNNVRATPAGTGDPTYVDKVLHFWSDISQGHDLPADHYESLYG